MTSTGPSPSGSSPIGRLEHLLAALLILAGIALRVPDLGRPFDRHFDGFQGAFFAVSAVNYERLGLAPTYGYPVADPELDPDSPETWYLYANHPPTVALLGWASVRAFGPPGWSEAWREDRAPAGIEPALRAPFFLAQLIGLAALMCAFAFAGAPRVGLLTGVLYAWAPIAVVYAGLANYENPSLAPLLVAAAALVPWVRRGSRAALATAALATAAACSVTYAPVFFLPPLCFWMLGVHRRRAILGGAVLLPASLAPLVGHALLSARAAELTGTDPDTISERAEKLLGPLLDGSIGIGDWLARQLEFGRLAFTSSGLALGALGLGIALVLLLLRHAEPGADRPAPAPPFPPRRAAGLALALTIGGVLVLLGFFRHTAGRQDPFMLNLAPGLCALGGCALAWLLGPARRPPAHRIALAAAALAAFLIHASLATAELRTRWRLPGPADGAIDGAIDGAAIEGRSSAPLPQTVATELSPLIPPGSVVWHPDALGLGFATGYYAWRTLMPVAPDRYGVVRAQQELYGKSEWPTYLLLPADPAGDLATQAAQIERDLLSAMAARGREPEPPLERDGWILRRVR